MHILVKRIKHSTRHPGLALLALLVLGLIQAAYALDDASIYSTVDEETVRNTDDGNGNTSTTTSHSTVETRRPGSAENRSDAWQHDPNAEKFPYDSTGGEHRNDLDTARQGFDDPRNPWDGRYQNDNPANHPAGSAYDRGEPIHNYTPGKYRPGAFHTNGNSGD